MTADTVHYLAEVYVSEANPPVPRRERAAAPVQLAGRPARILLAEDDSEMRNTLASALRSDGYEVVETASGSDLLEEMSILLFRGEPIPADLIVSDEHMPGVRGSQVLAEIREAHWPTPFILIAGSGEEEAHQRAYRLGAAAVFDKPFDVDDLRQTVTVVLQDQARGKTSTVGPEPHAGPEDAAGTVGPRADMN